MQHCKRLLGWHLSIIRAKSFTCNTMCTESATDAERTYPCLPHSCLSSSQLTAATLTMPLSDSATLDHLGASCLQCPHLQTQLSQSCLHVIRMLPTLHESSLKKIEQHSLERLEQLLWAAQIGLLEMSSVIRWSCSASLHQHHAHKPAS